VNQPEFSSAERTMLLGLARDAIAFRFRHERLALVGVPERLMRPRGVFVTLMIKDETSQEERLRGCVGQVEPGALAEVVAASALSAAFHDPRFQPLREEELPRLRIYLSVLSPLFLITAEQIELGKHGLIISHAGRRALLLPEVPTEMGWDQWTFLEQLCRKAGLPPDAWRVAKLEAFTTEAFGEDGD
jgi:AmmeMemoRadiSam system protein A